ncbi:MAG: DUF5703 domain-containing protein [Capsulimonadaceae bacterium]|nr:DUF5703 domain-containing protein [Capsulimonadaceae bacterium]
MVLVVALIAFGAIMSMAVSYAAEPSFVAAPLQSSRNAYEVVWKTPSENDMGSMPLGNGEVGVNVWAEPDGNLKFYISRTDSYSEVSRLLKVGMVSVALAPNPFKQGEPFLQRLDMKSGVIDFDAGSGTAHIKLRLFIDADQPVIHVVAHSDSPVSAKVRVESWREADRTLDDTDLAATWTMKDAPYPLVESADQFSRRDANVVAWYHRNPSSCVGATLKLQKIDTFPNVCEDPLINRTFGGEVFGSGLTAIDDRTLATSSPAKNFAVRIACPCAQTATVDEWYVLAANAAAASAHPDEALARTRNWWERYWANSWVNISGDDREEKAVPVSANPLRIGYDSDHRNAFPGSIGRTDVYRRALSREELAQLATTDRSLPAAIKDGLVAETDGTAGEMPSSKFDLANAFTLAAWVNPSDLKPGRIFDKLTAGKDDGFLLDTHPGDTLRFILGDKTISGASGILKTGQWQFVAASYDRTTERMIVMLDGKIVADSGSAPQTTVGQAYALQRYMQACGGRGVYPIKFNGGQFTVSPDGNVRYADYRHWGDTHWWQNIRHMYFPMLAEGDFEMMTPFFRMYEKAIAPGRARARVAENADGAFFPETMAVWGTYANRDYGWKRPEAQNSGVEECPYHAKTRNQGPELVSMMLDYWDYTRDEHFAKSELAPMAEAVLQYFDSRFKRNAAGKLVIQPTQSIETYWYGVVDDTPTVAGLRNIAPRLRALPKSVTTAAERDLFARIAAAVPDMPFDTRTIGGVETKVIAPAGGYDRKTSNCENPETYAIWPFRLYGVGKPDLDMARTTYVMRKAHLPVGWGYDGNDAATLGMTDEAKRILLTKCANSNPKYRWPASWGPNFDWLPDQNHGGNLLETTQLMLLQADGRKLYLFPAWPKEWDVDFRLHAPDNTTVEATLSGGKVTRLVVTPETRKADVVICLGDH